MAMIIKIENTNFIFYPFNKKTSNNQFYNNNIFNNINETKLKNFLEYILFLDIIYLDDNFFNDIIDEYLELLKDNTKSTYYCAKLINTILYLYKYNIKKYQNLKKKCIDYLISNTDNMEKDIFNYLYIFLNYLKFIKIYNNFKYCNFKYSIQDIIYDSILN